MAAAECPTSATTRSFPRSCRLRTGCLQADIALPHFLHSCTESQAARRFPKIVSGETILAPAISEPSAGSDVAALKTSARCEGDVHVVHGAKKFITNGQNATWSSLRSRPTRANGIAASACWSSRVPGKDSPGARKLAKVGQPAADTSELFFDGVRVPVENLLGDEGRGFYATMGHLAQERLSVAVQAVAQSRRSLETSVAYAKERTAFGIPIGLFQHNRIVLAELKTEVEIAQTCVNRCVHAHVDGALSAREAAQAKWWTTELCQKLVTVARSFTAATATCANARLRGPGSIAASRPSTRARPR